MKLRTFKGRTMSEALQRVKEAFGPNAVVLTTRTIDRSRILGLRGGPSVEITAAPDASDLPPAVQTIRMRAKPEDNTKANGVARPVKTSSAAQPAPPIVEELGLLKSMVAELVAHSRRVAPFSSPNIALATSPAHVPAELLEHHRRLVHNAVAEHLASSLVQHVRGTLPPEQWRDPASVTRTLARALEPMIPVAGGIGLRPRFDDATAAPTVVALVGPTGVGKTTTIAKLAANFALRERRRVGLVTLDTYRIAAVEQLRTYAQIMQVPLAVAATPSQLANAITEMQDRDLVLIDTAGRSQRDADRIEELQQFFQAQRPDELHLVLSGTTGERVLHQAIEKFSPLGIDRIIFSKLDEAIGFGVLLGCLERAKAKLSYITTGQSVPDDIELGTQGRIARCILDGAWTHSDSSADAQSDEKGRPRNAAAAGANPRRGGMSALKADMS